MTTISVAPHGGEAAPAVQSTGVLRQSLLTCGILSSLLYVAMNVIVPLQWDAYSSAAQTVSELSAVDAPTRQLWMWLGIPYTILVIAFALGVLRSAGKDARLQTTGSLILAYGVIGVLWPFAPMHLRSVLVAGGGTWTDTAHIILSMVTVALMLVSIGFAASVFGHRFRVYSVVTLVLLFVFGALTGMDSPKIAINQPTPWIGVWERVCIGAFLLWVVVFASLLMNRPARVSSRAL